MEEIIAKTGAEDAEFIAALCSINDEVYLGPSTKGGLTYVDDPAPCPTGQLVGDFHTHPEPEPSEEQVQTEFSETVRFQPGDPLLRAGSDLYGFVKKLAEPVSPKLMVNCLGTKYRGDNYIHCQLASKKHLTPNEVKNLNQLVGRAEHLTDSIESLEKQYERMDIRSEQADKIEQEIVRLSKEEVNAHAAVLDFAKSKHIFEDCAPKEGLMPATYIITQGRKVKPYIRTLRR
jgi:hypothetical protein